MSGKTVNDVTLFSNGIGHFRRTYHVPAGKEEKITIPFKTAYIGDVAASLQVFGKVRLSTPPSFTPANSNATSLQIDQDNALLSLLTQLSGASITVQRVNHTPLECVLLGVDSVDERSANGTVQKVYLVYQSTDGVIGRAPVEYIQGVGFNDESVRMEIQKALKMNFQKIKPDSTLLDLSLSADQATDAVVQYTIPVAAWKMRYSIREDKGKFTLEGAAIIDNSTDEDWDNFRISVVTGNPISFNTDIAEVVLPQRKMVRLVEGTALGNVEVEEGTRIMAACASPSRSMRAATKSIGPKMSLANYASFGLESAEADASATIDYVAEAPGVEAKEVGDFCVFTSKEPITILARKSAVVPMFSVALQHGGVVLLYKEQNHARRPYRAIKFKNETEYSLGRGKTVIYNEGVFSGECVLETAKPGENRMLPHCLENSVKVVKTDKGQKEERSSVRISDGVAFDERVARWETLYEITNFKDQPYKMALEYTARIGTPDAAVKFEGIEVKEQEKISDGWRAYFELAAKEKVTLRVVETAVYSQSIVLKDNFAYVTHCRLDSILDDAQVKACIKIQEQIDEIQQSIKDSTDRRAELLEQAERVRNNLQAIGQKGAVEGWVADLDTTEKEIRTIDSTTVPQLKAKVAEQKKKLLAQLKKIAVSWKA